jgi:hypothetical protein
MRQDSGTQGRQRAEHAARTHHNNREDEAVVADAVGVGLQQQACEEEQENVHLTEHSELVVRSLPIRLDLNCGASMEQLSAPQPAAAVFSCQNALVKMTMPKLNMVATMT